MLVDQVKLKPAVAKALGPIRRNELRQRLITDAKLLRAVKAEGQGR